MRRCNSMKKNDSIISLIALTIVGSIITFYTSNLFFADIANVANGFGAMFLVSLTGMMVGALIITAILYIARSYLRPNTRKRMASTYLFVAMGLSGVGFISALLAGIINYGNIAAANPFPGYIIIMMIAHLLVLAASIFVFFKVVKSLPADEEKYKVTVKHVFFTIGWFLFIALAFNRFGALLLMPTYVYARNLNVTFIFYLYLLVPMAILVKKGLDVFEVKYNKFIYSAVALGVNLVLMLLLVIIGKNDTTFISSVSPVMPLERLASMPVESIIHFVVNTSLTVFYFVTALIAFRKKSND